MLPQGRPVSLIQILGPQQPPLANYSVLPSAGEGLRHQLTAARILAGYDRLFTCGFPEVNFG